MPPVFRLGARRARDEVARSWDWRRRAERLRMGRYDLAIFVLRSPMNRWLGRRLLATPLQSYPHAAGEPHDFYAIPADRPGAFRCGGAAPGAPRNSTGRHRTSYPHHHPGRLLQPGDWCRSHQILRRTSRQGSVRRACTQFKRWSSTMAGHTAERSTAGGATALHSPRSSIWSRPVCAMQSEGVSSALSTTDASAKTVAVTLENPRLPAPRHAAGRTTWLPSQRRQ